MTFNDMMFNPQYVNSAYYDSIKCYPSDNDEQQNKEIENAVKAVHDLCEAVKKIDPRHQQTAFYACLAEIIKESNKQ